MLMSIPLTREERIQRSLDLGIEVDDEFQHLLSDYTWNEIPGGHLSTGYGNLVDYNQTDLRLIHHFIMGFPPEGFVIDHKDRNPKNNKRSNLRLVSRSDNVINSDRVENASNIYRQPDGCFFVRIVRNKKLYHLGTYKAFSEAKSVRDKWLADYKRERL